MHKHSATWEHKHVYFYLLAYQMKTRPKIGKTQMMGGKKIIENVSRNDSFEEKKMKGKTESPV